VFRELLGCDGIRIFNGVVITIAMLALTYPFYIREPILYYN